MPTKETAIPETDIPKMSVFDFCYLSGAEINRCMAAHFANREDVALPERVVYLRKTKGALDIMPDTENVPSVPDIPNNIKKIGAVLGSADGVINTAEKIEKNLADKQQQYNTQIIETAQNILKIARINAKKNRRNSKQHLPAESRFFLSGRKCRNRGSFQVL